ncbi:hypothetical protein Hanom_Chr16g01467821 [Helianthus anomalus]
MRTTHITPRASAFERGVTDWYQSFDCSEPGFLLKSSLQSLGSSNENNFYKSFHCIKHSATSTTQTFFQKSSKDTM